MKRTVSVDRGGFRIDYTCLGSGNAAQHEITIHAAENHNFSDVMVRGRPGRIRLEFLGDWETGVFLEALRALLKKLPHQPTGIDWAGLHATQSKEGAE